MHLPSALALALAALALGSISLFILFSRDDDLRMQSPQSLPAHHSAPTNSQTPIQASAARTEAPESAFKDVVDAGQLASSPTETKQPVTFSTHALIEAGVAEDVANGMVTIIANAELAHRHMVAQDMRNEMRYACELLFMAWPDLGDMIRRGQVKFDIVTFPPDKISQPRVPLVTGYDPTNNRVDYLFNLDRWSVRFFFTKDSSPNPQVFAKIASPVGDTR